MTQRHGIRAEAASTKTKALHPFPYPHAPFHNHAYRMHCIPDEKLGIGPLAQNPRPPLTYSRHRLLSIRRLDVRHPQPHSGRKVRVRASHHGQGAYAALPSWPWYLFLGMEGRYMAVTMHISMNSHKPGDSRDKEVSIRPETFCMMAPPSIRENIEGCSAGSQKHASYL